jgi:hypothetical protein
VEIPGNAQTDKFEDSRHMSRIAGSLRTPLGLNTRRLYLNSVEQHSCHGLQAASSWWCGIVFQLNLPRTMGTSFSRC